MTSYFMRAFTTVLRTLAAATEIRPASMPMIVMTTKSSTSVKPRGRDAVEAKDRGLSRFSSEEDGLPANRDSCLAGRSDGD